MSNLMKVKAPLELFRPPRTGRTFIGDAWEQWRMERVLKMVTTASEIQSVQHNAIKEYTSFGKQLEAETAKHQHEIDKMNIEKEGLKADAALKIVEVRLKENELKMADAELRLKLKTVDDILNDTAT